VSDDISASFTHMFSLRRLVIGAPIATERMAHERLPKILALPIFASDALSSTAYASEEIMAALLLAGTAIFNMTPMLSLAIIVLLTIVVISYRQIVMAYPSGGGAYIVAGDNLGPVPAQVAGASLLVDYILTVAVSSSAGIAAIVSLVKGFRPDSHIAEYTVPMCLLAVLFITIINLRGAKESGVAFAIPAYSFLLLMYGMIGYGVYLYMTGHLTPVHSAAEMANARYINENSGAIDYKAFSDLSKSAALFLILHAFSSGCTALTGVEAISNGVQAFKEPASKNAAITMTILAALLGTIFFGLSFLAVHANALPPSASVLSAAAAEAAHAAGRDATLGETVVSQVGRAVFGTSFLYVAMQVVTCIILVLAANTAFAGFPRLCALQAADGYLPRQLANIGDRLVYNNGIFILTFFSVLLIILFKGDVHHLIPLYAIGVFLSFTISQSGMVKRWFRVRDKGWKLKAAINGFGAICTFIVMIIFGVVKFRDGAWIVILVIPALVCLFLKIKKHYRSVAKQLSLEGYRPQQGFRQHVCVLVPDIHRGVIPALQLARSIATDARAIHISIDPARENRVRERWTLYSRGMPLTVLTSEYRSLINPVVEYIERLQAQDPGSAVLMVIPEFEPQGWFAKLLHGHAAFALAVRLHFMPGVMVVNVPYHIKSFVEISEEEAREAARSQALTH
jgi:amino acid transporter